ncbi:hypothetical protein HYFRA_00010627 [Hymenoscyphus fraxineus]|uniref:methionyl-tRNA formyltransferase n=1 Tax=Hymenoscyphus fraxineus TaxID=746836 RepID=A0A9N9L8W9_9HELO|nr:hypothetical protein HYFRA_00010627 [Hymenoscyphus fraxineus]
MRLLLHKTLKLTPKSLIRTPCHRLYSTPRHSRPLRILFCGSDEFSCASLSALHEEHLRNPGLIASIDVLHQTPKRAGRGLSSLRPVPIISAARQLGIPTHTPDECWGSDEIALPTPNDQPINLIIAVSFGLFIPGRILEAVEYGGLNIHPSLLPNYRGAAPLQHAIINNEPYTGITLQTLSPTTFDGGLILSQTPPHEIPVRAHKTTYHQLLSDITPKAASLLLQGLRDGLYIPPLIDVSPFYAPEQKGENNSVVQWKKAPKITGKDSEINWGWSIGALIRRQNALGRLRSVIWKPIIPIPEPPPDHVPSKKDKKVKAIKKRSADILFPTPTYEILSAEKVNKIIQRNKHKKEVKECKLFAVEFSSPTHPSLETPSSPTEPHEPPKRKIHWLNNHTAAILLFNGSYIQIPRLMLSGQEIKNAAQVLLPFSLRVRDLWAEKCTVGDTEGFLERLRLESLLGVEGEEVVEVVEEMEEDREEEEKEGVIRRVNFPRFREFTV